jgi:isopenicillin N synthase-like dioxygenase
VPVGEEGVESGTPDLKEAFDTALDLPADDPDYLAGNPMLGPNTWPDLPGFADAVTAYYHAVLDVGHRLPDGSLEIGQFGQQALQKQA